MEKLFVSSPDFVSELPLGHEPEDDPGLLHVRGVPLDLQKKFTSSKKIFFKKNRLSHQVPDEVGE